MPDIFTPELVFGPMSSGIMTPTAPGVPYRTIQPTVSNFIVLSSSGASFSASRTILSSVGTPYVVPRITLSSTGVSYSV